MRAYLGPLVSCALCALASAAAAQDSVVLLAPPEVRAEWTAALQLELAAQGTVAIPEAAPDVATPLLGDAEAQQVAIARGARAAVWVESRPDAWRLRMVSASAERARVVPVARDADARTVALILVSLLDGPVEPPSAIPEPPWWLARAVSPWWLPRAARALAEPSVRETEASIEPRGEPYVRWSGRVGLSMFALTSDVRIDGGFTLRAGIAMRYAGFEAAILHDLGLYFEHGNGGKAQPFGRACVEGGGATERTAVAFHAGVRACFGSVFALESTTDGGFFVSDGPRTHISGGAYAAASFAITSSLRFFVRGDVDAAWTDFATFDAIDAVPAVSGFLSFE